MFQSRSYGWRNHSSLYEGDGFPYRLRRMDGFARLLSFLYKKLVRFS